MTLKFSTDIRNARLSLINTAVNAGPSTGRVNIYSGTRPSAGSVSGTLLISVILHSTGFFTPSNGVMTAKEITPQDISTSGVASWFRMVDSTGEFVCDGDVATSGGDMTVPTTTFTDGVTLTITSLVLTDGN